MDVLIRNERPGDYRETEEVTREAFWNVHEPGCCEHYLAHLMRERPEFIRELDFVAVRDGRIVGNIMYARTEIQCDDGTTHAAVTFGPISVLPAYQGQAFADHPQTFRLDQPFDGTMSVPEGRRIMILDKDLNVVGDTLTDEQLKPAESGYLLLI